MKGPDKLLAFEDNWVTDIGQFFPGERAVYRGKDLFQDLSKISWMGLFLYGITGRFFSQQQLRLFEALWTISVSYPDPRLWNNRVAALAGTARSTCPLAVSAASAVTEATIYGNRANVGAIDFLIRTRKRLSGGMALADLVEQEIKKHRVIFGFGRPLVGQDERIAPLMSIAEQLQLNRGPHVKLVFDVEKCLEADKRRWRMNITGLAAALSADQGLNVREYHAYVTPAFIAGMTPCYMDACNHPEGSLFPLRCSRIDYRGKPPRGWT